MLADREHVSGWGWEGYVRHTSEGSNEVRGKGGGECAAC